MPRNGKGLRAVMKEIRLSSPVSELSGVGAARKAALEKSGIRTIEDLIRIFPRNYQSGKIYPVSEERCDIFSGFHLTVDSAPAVLTLARRRVCLRFTASDENGTKVQILYFNQPYLRNQIFKGEDYYFFGSLQEKNGVFYLFSPTREKEAPDPDRLRPVYPTIGKISSKQLEKLMEQCLVPTLSQIRETLPTAVVERFGLLSRTKATFLLHCPTDEKSLAAAKYRFAFENLFRFSMKATLFSEKNSKKRVPAFDKVNWNEFLSVLPFQLTDGQTKALCDIENDMVGNGNLPPMNRLIQGDVGSGKTALAWAAAYLAAKNNKSTLVMAPTEILAQQHYASFSRIFTKLCIPVFLLTGSTTKKEREAIFRETVKDEPYILIGTHALTEDGAMCKNVALAITDEQHRFGVRHRNILSEKGGAYHSLVMSATPIPRSLAMFLYAAGHVSVIDTLPPGRIPVETLYVGEDKMPRVYSFLREKASLGQQCYIVCPLIEDGEDKSDLQSAEEEWNEVKKALPDIPSLLLHGKMKNEEKNQVMDAFKRGDVKILVSTTVIEVGVDVPSATVMVIRSAERFGLSQLHQLRGRVGRGNEKSYCVLVSSHSGKTARERLKKLCDCHDGFELAKFDLKTRGPGEFFGTRQSGFNAIDLTDSFSMEMIEEASKAAKEFLLSASEEELAIYGEETKLN